MTGAVRDVVVVGAGIAGLNAALALHAQGFRVTVLERDGAPPPDAEIDWRRRGVPHAVHPHFFMGRLRSLFQSRHPRLLERMIAAGVGERRFEEYLHPLAREVYRPEPIDPVLTALAARRTSFERLLRQHVEEEKIAVLIPEATVTRLVLDEGGPPVRVRGVEAEVSGAPRRFEAEVVIDASGRTGRLHEQLEEAGARFEVERHDCGLLYFTRCYRLRPGQSFPTTTGLPAQLFPDFLAGALQGDNGTFTVTVQVYEGDDELVALAKDVNRFVALCERLPWVAPWISPDRSEPAGGIHGFGLMDCFWRSTVVDGKPQVSGFFFVGDTVVRSNPRFGRGCTWGAVGAHLLADILAETADPAERVLRYERTLEKEFRADWRTMLATDRSNYRRFEAAVGKKRPMLADRLGDWFEARLSEALVADPVIFRALWTGYHGLTGMSEWTRHPANWIRFFRLVAGGRRKFRSVLRDLRSRPSRAEMLAIQPTTGGIR